MGAPLQIMFLGTGSDVGKSVIAAAFCRILKRRGFRVAPFKSQNMALNSFVTMQGEEMGRAQVMQAHAAGVAPSSDMNPLLLKPSGQSTTQVILQGRVYDTVSARGYYGLTQKLLPAVLDSYNRLAGTFDAIVLEGAGSATEMNLKRQDIVNIELAKIVRAPVVVVADIERGGVFSSLVGTMRLFTRRERRHVIGFIVNRFRGDITLFDEGVGIIEKLTRRPVFGVAPYFSDIHLPEEDSVALLRGKKGTRGGDGPRLVVIHLPYIANYTDFDPFEIEPSVSLLYSKDPADIAPADAVIIPGTKNTIEDLLWLKERGFEKPLKRHVAGGGILAGICGGFQMLGMEVEDPYGVESAVVRAEGLGFLDIRTVLDREKKLTRVEGTCTPAGAGIFFDSRETPPPVTGYEIHMGVTSSGAGQERLFRVSDRAISGDTAHEDGIKSRNGKVWGTYLHGVFENDDLRNGFLRACGRADGPRLFYRSYVEGQYDKLADLIEGSVDVDGVIAAASRFRQDFR
jgi:adenosylcobyric acid synthase